ncbi:MAG: hypothetical protein AB7V50_00300, partial [Vampirovibrionia bacterium]
MTIRANQLTNQALIMQQLQAARNRVAKIESQQTDNKTEVKSAGHDNKSNDKTANNEQNQFDTLNSQAANNIHDHKNLVNNLKQAKNEVNVHQSLLDQIKGSKGEQNTQNEDLKDNPTFQKLSDDLKQRSDVKSLINSVPQEALIDPDKAVQSLVGQALMGNKKAYEKLDEYSRTPFDKLQEKASKGIESVVNGADGKPLVLEVIASVPTDKSNEAAAKLLNLAHKNPRAVNSMEKLLAKGDINFTKTAQRAKELDPGQAAKSINRLMINGSLSKTD